MEKMPQRASTKRGYDAWIDNHIAPRWANSPFCRCYLLFRLASVGRSNIVSTGTPMILTRIPIGVFSGQVHIRRPVLPF